MNFNAITPDLFIGTTPAVNDYPRLRDLGVRLVINMRWERRPAPDPHRDPISFLWLPTVDSPLFPIPLRKLTNGARTAMEIIRSGGKVYAHCAEGRHRGVAMGACILVAQGYDPFEAMALIKDRRAIADPFAFYIRPRIVKFARQWEAQSLPS